MCMHIVFVCMLTPTCSHTPVCVVLSTGPGCFPLGPPLLLPLLPLLRLYPYPPFDVSHIPFSATLIVFCNYFHPSAIVTGGGCTALNKLVEETQRRATRCRSDCSSQRAAPKNTYATVDYKLKLMANTEG